MPYDLPQTNIISITFVRDPVERFISHYFLHRNHKVNWVNEAKILPISKYIEYGLEEKNQPMYINGETRFLTGFPNQEGLERVKKQAQKGQFYIFPLSRFDESCLLLERLFPQQLKDCSYPKYSNVSQKDQKVITIEYNLM